MAPLSLQRAGVLPVVLVGRGVICWGVLFRGVPSRVLSLGVLSRRALCRGVLSLRCLLLSAFPARLLYYLHITLLIGLF